MIFVFLIISGSCKHKEFDAEYYARQYCECLQEERKSGKDFLDARSKCDGELLVCNQFFRADYIEFTYGRYLSFFSIGRNDSVADFHMRFYKYLEENCCKLALTNCDKNDSFQIKRKNIDSLIKH